MTFRDINRSSVSKDTIEDIELVLPETTIRHLSATNQMELCLHLVSPPSEDLTTDATILIEQGC